MQQQNGLKGRFPLLSSLVIADLTRIWASDVEHVLSHDRLTASTDLYEANYQPITWSFCHNARSSNSCLVLSEVKYLELWVLLRPVLEE